VIARTVRVLVAVLVLAAGLLVGARPIGSAPSLGPFLEPAHGVWSLARAGSRAREAEASIPALRDTVRVVYDDRAVPHVFARTEEDAYRALGFVVARDRLFQLYVQTLAASGRLSELAGKSTVPLDREMRQLGLPRAAEQAMARLPDTSAAMRVARAYADGINAYAASMPASELPLEFRLLRRRFPAWQPIDTYYLQNRMSWTLAFISLEHDRAAAAARVGAEAAKALFPDDSPIQEPIQPNGRGAPRFDFHPLPPPGAPDTTGLLVASALERLLGTSLLATPSDEGRWLASNNWAVSPARSATKHALLAGDPHLDLTLPSIWYEAHLVVPGALDVYGATIPGAPAIVLGFNRDVAWTFTNTGADVMDVYVEQVDDDARPMCYRLDGAWRPLERRVERYRGRLGETIGVDTVLFTHRGPLQRVRGKWVSIRWTALEAGREGTGFLDASHARSAAAFEDAMAASYQAPAQNMLAADRAGHIAIRSTGRYPVRPGAAGGGVPFDGTTSASDWTGDLPVAQWPQALDPAQGFLASANQQPMDPRTTPVWFGGSYDPWRALRINALLRADSAVTVNDMRRFQTDPGSARADYIVPFFVSAARRVAARGTGPRRDVLDAAARMLERWDRRYTPDNTVAVLFEAAMRETATETWDELSTVGDVRRATPSNAVLAELMSDSASAWWDDRGTAAVEDRDAILAASLAKAFINTRRRLGEPGEGWTWSRVYRANIPHLLRLPALSALGLAAPGGPGTLSPLTPSGSNGPSWRMVVELGPTLHAWTTYPGGQSGNPVSPRYRDRIPQWQAGTLEAVHLPMRPEELPPAQRSATLLLHP
jgi:penicillin amidase